MISKKTRILCGLLACAGFLMTAVSYPLLPEQIPTNWQVDGSVAYSPKIQIWLLYAMMPLFAVLFDILPLPEIRAVLRPLLHLFRDLPADSAWYYPQRILLSRKAVRGPDHHGPSGHSAYVARQYDAKAEKQLLHGNQDAVDAFRRRYLAPDAPPWRKNHVCGRRHAPHLRAVPGHKTRHAACPLRHPPGRLSSGPDVLCMVETKTELGTVITCAKCAGFSSWAPIRHQAHSGLCN